MYQKSLDYPIFHPEFARCPLNTTKILDHTRSFSSVKNQIYRATSANE